MQITNMKTMMWSNICRKCHKLQHQELQQEFILKQSQFWIFYQKICCMNIFKCCSLSALSPSLSLLFTHSLTQPQINLGIELRPKQQQPKLSSCVRAAVQTNPNQVDGSPGVDPCLTACLLLSLFFCLFSLSAQKCCWTCLLAQLSPSF